MLKASKHEVHRKIRSLIVRVRSGVDDPVTGRTCKRCKALSEAILIDRGLNDRHSFSLSSARVMPLWKMLFRKGKDGSLGTFQQESK